MQELGKFPKKSERAESVCFYEFGPYRLNPLKRVLSRAGEPVSLTPKSFEILMALVENHGEVLLKEDLMLRIWPDTAVEEGNLNRNISTLRKALGESPNDHRYIVTVPGRGYQFVAEVQELYEELSKRMGNDSRAGNAVEPVHYLPDATGRRAKAKPIAVPLASVVRPEAPKGMQTIRSSLFWITGGAAVGLALLAGIFLLHARLKPALNETDLLLISDFANTTGDAVFDDTLKQGISVQLAESPFLNILSDARIRATLKLMTKPPDARLTPEVARDVCQRAGGKAYIAGSISSLGSRYVIGLDVVDCGTGDVLAQEQVTAERKEGVLRSLDQAAAMIRERLGESLSTVQRFDTPLEQATTPSLDALKAYTQGNLVRDKKGDAAAVPFFQRAIELDPRFALAYDALGITYSNLDEPGLASENITKAYDLQVRVSERERFQMDANYNQIVTGELEKANEISELWAQTYPRDEYPHNLLGVNYEFLGQYEKAVAEMSEAVRLNPDGVILHSNLMEDYTALGRLDQARTTYRLAVERKLDHPFLHADMYGLAFLENDRAEMEREVAWAAGQAGAEDLLLSLESDTDSFLGKLQKARDDSRRAVASAQQTAQKETAALWQMNAALREAEFGNATQARKETSVALELATTRDVQILAALALARSGDTDHAQKIGEDLAKRFPLNTVLNRYWLPTIGAAIELNRGNSGRALELLRVSTPYELGYPNPEVEVGRFLYPIYLRGQAYLFMHRGSEGAAEFHKLLERPSLVLNCPLGALAHLGLARAYVLQGDTAKGKTAYRDFLTLWKDADPDIPVLIAAKSEYAKLK
jgi:eukaryotic-like serine/threonine-protein kinase